MKTGTLVGDMFMSALGLSADNHKTAMGDFDRDYMDAVNLRALTGQYNVEINAPQQHCSECPHCKKIAREETLKAMDIAQHLLDKKAKYEKRCKDWVEKIRELSRI